jgi:subtilisin family serine protease
VRRFAAPVLLLAALCAPAPAHALVPDDPALVALVAAGGTPSLPDQWWAPRSGFPVAWDLVAPQPATVAVIDTGIDATHPEIAPQLLAAVDQDGDPSRGPATIDENGHGTHVASLACAAPGNGQGIAGAGMGCRLIVEKTDLTDASVAASITDAVRRGADAINMSFGTDDGHRPAKVLVDAIDDAYAKGVVLVAAAADRPRREQGAPANLLQLRGTGADIDAGKGLTVTAATSGDERAPFAGRGSQISLAAYGAVATDRGARGLLGAFPSGSTTLERGGTPEQPTGCGCRTTYRGDGRYAYLEGTSMAAPQVAATAALMRRLNPDLAVRDVLRIIKRTARRPAGQGWSPELGWGILDAGRAMQAARGLDRTAPRSELVLAAPVGDESVALRWRARDAAPPGVKPSGVARYEVWRAAGGRPQRVMTTTGTSALVPVAPGVRNRWYTIAVDRYGNREAPPTTGDRTRVRTL